MLSFGALMKGTPGATGALLASSRARARTPPVGRVSAASCGGTTTAQVIEAPLRSETDSYEVDCADDLLAVERLGRAGTSPPMSALTMRLKAEARRGGGPGSVSRC